MSSSTRRSIRFGAPAVIAALLVSVVLGSAAGAAQTRVGLGTATSFSVLAGSGITNTGPTTVNGDIGTFPTTTITGAGSITFTNPAVNHAGDSVTQGAKTDLQTAYDDAGSRLPNIAQDAELGGEVLTEGVYQGGATGLTGDLTLNFQGSDTTQFVFKLTALTTASNSNVIIQNPGPAGTDACRVVWQISSSVTFGTSTDFVGDVLAHTSITANTSSTFQGRLLALNGAVTLDTNTINIGSCTQVAPTATTTTTTFIPTPVTTAAPTTTTTVRRTTTSTTSTTAAPTTTTAPLPTTTTVVPAPVVVAALPTPPSGVDLQVAAPPSTTPVVTPPTGRPELPRTGNETLPLAVIGVGMVVVGTGIVRLEERTRQSRARR